MAHLDAANICKRAANIRLFIQFSVQSLLTEFRIDGETVMVTPAASFYRNSEGKQNQVRIAYVLEVPSLKKAFHILAEALKAYPGRTN